MKKLIIIPAYNEERNIGRFLGDIKKSSVDFDVIVINDGSTDATSKQARRCGVPVVDLPSNLGIGGAVQTGYRYAWENGYEVAVQMDADSQHPIDFLKELLAPLEAGEADMVIGSRFSEKQGYQSTWMRRLGIRFLSTLTRFTMRQRLLDVTSGFRMANRKVIRLLARWYPQDYPEPESLIYLSKYGIRFREVPVRMLPRQAGQSSISLSNSFYYLFKVTLAITLTALFYPNKQNMEAHLYD